MWKKLLTAAGLLIVTGILVIVVVENYAIYSQRNLASIEVLKIGSDQCSFTLPLKQAEAMYDPTVKIELYAKEGPFWIETDRTFSDLRICSCRMTGLMAFYSRFDIPDRKAKEKILQFICSQATK